MDSLYIRMLVASTRATITFGILALIFLFVFGAVIAEPNVMKVAMLLTAASCATQYAITQSISYGSRLLAVAGVVGTAFIAVLYVGTLYVLW